MKNCEGFHEHIAEYKNDPKSTFFVTVIADVLVGHGLKVKLEPDVPLQNKKPDIYAFQSPDGLGVFFECKRPKEDTKHLLSEQRKMFDGIEDVISDEYSLALFYEKTLSSAEIKIMRDLTQENLSKDNNIYENRHIIDNANLGVKLLVSGTGRNIEKNSLIEIAGIPNFSDEKGYTNANGINRYGKNIVFYKSASKNTINSQLANSHDKVPEGSPYVICIDCSGPRFDLDEYSKYILNIFNDGQHTSFSGVFLIDHGLIDDGKYRVHLHFVENKNAKYSLSFLKDYFTETIAVDINERYKNLNNKGQI